MNNFFVGIPWYELEEPKDYFPVFPKEKMKFSPGKRFSYCNSGYVLLAAIITEVSGIAYNDFLEEYLFKAIGMHHSGFFALNRLPEKTAIGYVKDNKGWRTNVYNLPIIGGGGGDGGAFTTVDDLYILWDALLHHKILSKDLTELFIKPFVKTEGENLYYGHGIWVYTEDQMPTEEYILGCDAGISFKSALIREKDIIYTVISNTGDGAWPIINDIVRLV